MNLFRPLVLIALIVFLFPAAIRLCAAPPAGPDKFLGVNTDPDTPWGLDVPQPEIPPRPVNYDLSDINALRPSAPRFIDGDAALEALRREGDFVTAGTGAEDDPYIIENWHFTEFYPNPPGHYVGQLILRNTTKHVLIRNTFFEGSKVDDTLFDNRYALTIISCRNVTVRNSRSILNRGMYATHSSHLNFEYIRSWSVGYGIFTNVSSHVRAYRCYVNDTTEIGIFLYNGPDNVIEECYVHNTGREGIGSHANAPRHVYRNNFIMNAGWNGINMEGRGDDHLIEGNTIINTHYGILVMGKGGTVRNNKIFNCTQNGLILWRAHDCVVEDNLIVGSMQDGIWIFRDTSNNTIRNNRLIHSADAIRIEGPNNEGGHVITGNTISRFMRGVRLTAAGGSGTVIENNTFSGGRNAILSNDATDVNVKGNTFIHNLHGPRAIKGTGWNVSGNTFRFVGMPIEFIDSADCVAEDNTAEGSYYNSFAIRNSQRITFRNNRLRLSRAAAIHVGGSKDCVIEGNELHGSGGHVAWTATGGVILRNTTGTTIANNTFRRSIQHAVRFRENCFDNVLRGNVYEDNPFNIQIPESTLEHNTLDTDQKISIIADDRRQQQGLPPAPDVRPE